MNSKNGIIITICFLIVFVLGSICGGIFTYNLTTKKETIISVEHDTLYTQIHDTCFIETIKKVVRKDTVLLAKIDTIMTIDSVLVEVPIEEKNFIGEHYNIVTEGFKVNLKSVDIEYPTITNTITKTITKQKHWSGNIGLQAGYGITAHGWSPYAGLGVGFGYNF